MRIITSLIFSFLFNVSTAQVLVVPANPLLQYWSFDSTDGFFAYSNAFCSNPTVHYFNRDFEQQWVFKDTTERLLLYGQMLYSKKEHAVYLPGFYRYQDDVLSPFEFVLHKINKEGRLAGIYRWPEKKDYRNKYFGNVYVDSYLDSLIYFGYANGTSRGDLKHQMVMLDNNLQVIDSINLSIKIDGIIATHQSPLILSGNELFNSKDLTKALLTVERGYYARILTNDTLAFLYNDKPIIYRINKKTGEITIHKVDDQFVSIHSLHWQENGIIVIGSNQRSQTQLLFLTVGSLQLRWPPQVILDESPQLVYADDQQVFMYTYLQEKPNDYFKRFEIQSYTPPKSIDLSMDYVSWKLVKDHFYEVCGIVTNKSSESVKLDYILTNLFVLTGFNCSGYSGLRKIQGDIIKAHESKLFCDTFPTGFHEPDFKLCLSLGTTFDKVDINTANDKSCNLISSNEESVHSRSISISPNPVHDLITISTTLDLSYYEIYNMQGTMVTGDRLLNNTIQVRSLIAGVYMLKVRLSRGGFLTKKFIVN